MIAALLSLALSAGDVAPTREQLLRAIDPKYQEDASAFAGTHLAAADDQALPNGGALLLVVTSPEPFVERRTYEHPGLLSTIYLLRPAGKAWKVVGQANAGEAGDTGHLEVSVRLDGLDLGKAGVAALVQVGSSSDGEGSKETTTLFQVGDKALKELLKCESSSSGDGYPSDNTRCRLESAPGGIRRTVHTSSCEEPEKDCTGSDESALYRWNGSALEEVAAEAPQAEAAHPDPLVKSATASSVLREKGLPADYYLPAKAYDGLEKTAWAEGVAGPGVGQWLQLELQKPVRLKGLELLAGCGANPARRTLNERLKKLKVTTSDGKSQLVDLKDTTERQQVPLATAATTSLRLEIVEVYPGKKYQDACLSELVLQAQ